MKRSRAHLFPAAPFSRLPYWLLAILLCGALVAWSLVRAEDYRVIFRTVSRGIVTTLYVSVIASTAARRPAVRPDARVAAPSILVRGLKRRLQRHHAAASAARGG